jgi:hypothetical protein
MKVRLSFFCIIFRTSYLLLILASQWESWDPDLKETKDVVGGCENGTTCTFVMNDGNNIPVLLSNVKQNTSLTFSGGMFAGLLKFEGRVLISPIDSSTSKIDYRYVVELNPMHFCPSSAPT